MDQSSLKLSKMYICKKMYRLNFIIPEYVENELSKTQLLSTRIACFTMLVTNRR